jgi:hypothetical protein
VSEWKRPGDSAGAVDTASEDDSAAVLHAADASGAPLDEEAVTDDAPGDEEVERTSNRGWRRNLVLLVSGLLVIGVAQVVLSWFILTATNRAGDQQALANGLQRCLISAQLNNNSSADPQGTAYRAAVQSCLSK